VQTKIQNQAPDTCRCDKSGEIYDGGVKEGLDAGLTGRIRLSKGSRGTPREGVRFGEAADHDCLLLKGAIVLGGGTRSPVTQSGVLGCFVTGSVPSAS